MEKPKVGDIRPIYQTIGFEVCKKTSEDNSLQEWVQVESIGLAEILSMMLRK